MCGIGGALSLAYEPVPNLEHRLQVMNDLQRHRGPDGEGTWRHDRGYVGLAHRRLSIIDLDTGDQPMSDRGGNWIAYNGEIYNYLELREELGRDGFATTSDTEVILHGYRKWGRDCVNHFRGMFAFALWDESSRTLFCARDRFGIKPFYYTIVDNVFYFASEAKALLPFLEKIEVDTEGLKDYLTFQFCLPGKTLFKGVHELPAGHLLGASQGNLELSKYWEVYFDVDFGHTQKHFEEETRDRLSESVSLHLRSDVPLGAYISGGVDSSIVASLASSRLDSPLMGFTGKFSVSEEYDESRYAEIVADWCDLELHQIDISANDFLENIQKVIYHLDYPVAGPGSFPQYMVSGLVSRHRKVALGGQGGDEIFGGYSRYLIAYFEQCIKASIDGTMDDGNFVVTYESIIPSLASLRNYKPMLQDFWREGLFEDMDKRYFRLINRATTSQDMVDWELLGDYSPYDTFKTIFDGNNVRKASYFDLMTHFDFKTLLPALLQVEDRVSMAHGLESRVPFLDHPLIEMAATMPADIKFAGGQGKRILKEAMGPVLPPAIVKREDKMGFPVPFTEWIRAEARDFVHDTLSSVAATGRDLVDNAKVLERLESEPRFGRTVWGFLSLELWQQEFHDKQNEYKKLIGGVGNLT